VANVALDTFTEVAPVSITGHTPDLGYGGWEDLGVGLGTEPTVQLSASSQSGMASAFLKTNNINTKHYRSTSDVSYDLTNGFDVVFRGGRSTNTFALDRIQIFIFQGNGASDQEGVAVGLWKNAGATVQVDATRYNASRVTQETQVIDDAFSLAASTGKTFKFEFRPDGSNWNIQAFYKNLDGSGDYTQIIGDGTGDIGGDGTAVITGAVTGASNSRLGIAGAGNSVGSWWETDDLAITGQEVDDPSTFQVADALPSGVIDSGTETEFLIHPTYVVYPDKFITVPNPGESGPVIIHRPLKDPRERQWVWVGYRPDSIGYSDLYIQLLNLVTKLREAAGKTINVFLKENVSANLTFFSWDGTVFQEVSDFVRVKVTDVAQRVTNPLGRPRYETTMTFIIDDPNYDAF
jgi:hypothetical protein